MTYRYPKPAVLDKLPAGRFAVLEASAGTGKTFTLEHLVVDKLIAGARLEEVLVVTFTEKATREMARRVRETLGRIIRAAHEPPTLSEQDPYWTIDAATRTHLLEAFVRFEHAPISTIHGFCQRILADHAFRSRRPFGHTLVEPRRAFNAAFRDELRVTLGEDSPLRRVLLGVLDVLDVDALEGLLFRWHLEKGRVRPEWDPERFREALAKLGDAPLSQWIHQSPIRSDVAARLDKTLSALVSIATDFARHGDVLQALTEVDRWGRKEVVQNEPARLWVPARLGRAPEAMEAVLALLSVAPPLFGILVHELVPRIAIRLRAQKDARLQIDFDDMLSLVEEALYAPDGGPLVDALRDQYKHALVDEFQDTDDTQWAIFRKLYVDAGSTGTLTLIGDPKQAIYGFRNADVHTYFEARQALVGNDAVPLDRCFRATAPLIRRYNQIFEEDDSEGFFRGVVRYDHPVSPGDPTRRLLTNNKEKGAPPQDAPAVVLLQIAGREKPRATDLRAALASKIALEARAIVDGGLQLLEGGHTRALRYSDIHVLVRSANEANHLAEGLRQAGVPYAFFKQDGLFQTKEAHDLLDVMRAVIDPTSRADRLRAWLTDFFEVPLEDMDSYRDLDARHPLVAGLHGWHRRAARRESGLLRAFLVESGLVRRLLFRAHGGRALTNYEHLVEILLEERGSGASMEEMALLLEAFIDGRAEPVRGGTVQRQGGTQDAIQLLTMHKSKGLEAPVVFLGGGFTRAGVTSPYEPLVAMSEDETRRREAWLPPLPHDAAARAAAEAREEDVRLLYVAITRAKGRVYLPYFGPPPVQHHAELAGRQPFGPLVGPYRFLDEQLARLVTRGYVDDHEVTFEVVPADLRAQGKPPKAPPPPPLEHGEAPDFERLRADHAGFTLTSYTRIKASAESAYVPTVPMDDDGARAEEFAAEVALIEEDVLPQTAEDPAPAAASSTSPQGELFGDQQADAPPELPGGAAIGIFLHELLEHLDFRALRVAEWAEWRDTHRDRFAQSARSSGIDEDWTEGAATLLWHALRAPLSLGDAHLPEGLCMVEKGVAEMELFYPIPEADHPPLGTFAPHPIRRGVIRGIVDWVFEWEGRTYFLDWKSDRVPADQPSLQSHVDANYRLQARLYTLGIVRMLGIRDEATYEARFGGLIYAFLRVMGPDQGVVFERPGWQEVLAWDEELRHAERPFGYAIR